MTRLSLLTLVTALLSVPAGACDYALSTVKMEQCRPIELVEQPGGDSIWRYAEGMGAGKVVAHIACRCELKLAAPENHCAMTKSVPLTTTVQTSDILATCKQKDALCEAPCALLPK